MSIAPMMFSNWWDRLTQPHSLLDQDFGLDFDPDLQRNFMDPFWALERRPRNYYRPWMQTRNQGSSVVTPDKDQFLVSLDVQQFKPDEITVKVVDKFIVIEGKHEEQQDEHGFISRQFTRKYFIPEQCDIDAVKSSLSSDGVLSITCPRKQIELTGNEKVVPIEHTGKPAIVSKEKAVKKAEEKPEVKKTEKMIK